MIERFLWSLFNYAEVYTFLLVWVAVPLSFLAGYLYIRRVSEPVLSPVPSTTLSAAQVSIPEPGPSNVPVNEPKMNVNDANV